MGVQSVKKTEARSSSRREARGERRTFDTTRAARFLDLNSGSSYKISLKGEEISQTRQDQDPFKPGRP